MKTTLLYITVFFCLTQQFYAQEDGVVGLNLPVRNSLKFNRYAINPTFSYVREQNKYISFSNKREWIQFDDAPQTYLFSLAGRFNENIGAGIGLFQQNYGVLTTFGGMLNFAYNATLDRDSNLTFGMNLAFYKSGINDGNVVTNYPDPSLDDIPSNSIITVNPGINYGTAFFDFGVSINNAVAYNLKTSKLIEENPEQSVQAHVMYTGYVNSRGFFDESKFSGLLRSEFKRDETVVSGIVMLVVPKGVWAQAGYNSLYGVSGGIGLNITNQISLEYNYEKAIGDLTTFGSSHEITLAYKFSRNYRYNYSDYDEEGALITKSSRRSVAKSKSSGKSDDYFRANRIANAKAKEEALAKAEQEAQRLAEEANAKAKAEEEAQARLAAEAQVKAEEEARIKLEQEALAKQEAEALAKAEQEAQRLAEEANAKAKAEEEAQAKLAAEAQAKAEQEAKAKAEEEKINLEELDGVLIPVAKDATARSMESLTRLTTDAGIKQQDLLTRLNETVASRQQDLDDLKEENDLSEQGIYKAPKPFKSLTAENAALESLKSEIDNTISTQNEKIHQLETLYNERLKDVSNRNDSINKFYFNTIEKLKAEQSKTIRNKETLLSTLEEIKVATEIERKRRIKRAAYDNEEDRYQKGRVALNTIKQNTSISTVPLKEEDFDFGEEQGSNIRIVKDVTNAESGYYLVIAVHGDVSKRDDFLTKTVSAGQRDVDFFYDVTSSKYFIYYEKFDDIDSARRALEAKGSEPYNGKLSIVKIEN